MGVSCNGMGYMYGYCILDFIVNFFDAKKFREKRLVVFLVILEFGVKLVLKYLENNLDDFVFYSLLNENLKLFFV